MGYGRSFLSEFHKFWRGVKPKAVLVQTDQKGEATACPTTNIEQREADLKTVLKTLLQAAEHWLITDRNRLNVL